MPGALLVASPSTIERHDLGAKLAGGLSLDCEGAADGGA